MTVDATSAVCNLGLLDSLSQHPGSVTEISHAWNAFCISTESVVSNCTSTNPDPSNFVSQVRILRNHGLQSLLQHHFLTTIQELFEKNSVSKFWQHFDAYTNVIDTDLIHEDEVQQVLHTALEEITLEKQNQERCLAMLTHALQFGKETTSEGSQKSDTDRVYLSSKYQLIVSSTLMTTLPRHFPQILHWYFKGRLEELNTSLDGEYQGLDRSQDEEDMDLDNKNKFLHEKSDTGSDKSYQGKSLENSKLVKNIGKVVHDLRSLGFTSLAEDAYASAIFMLLKAKVNEFAGDDYRSSVLDAIKGWIQAVPLQFLHALLAYLGDTLSNGRHSSILKSPLASHSNSLYPGSDAPSEGIVRWQLRLEYFAYETLQDLRIAKLFEIIVDYPDSSAAIEDLKQCLEYTGQHSKLVDSFISALRYRLLTAVGEPIREYLRGRKDTIKCIVTMLTDGTSGPGSVGDSLLEEINRDEENLDGAGLDDEISTDDKQAWIDAERWEPDPVEADPLKSSRSRRKIDILGMIVSIIGSKDQLVNEYRVMLAEKLLNKTDYDIDSEIRTLELLKIHFGESSMQKCEIMLNDLIDSKRTNTNVKATIKQKMQSGIDSRETDVPMDVFDATIISSNFWPPIQEEALNIPGTVDNLLTDYATRFNEIKTPRKLLWKKNLGTVKLELQFEDRELQFTVTPIHASIIMQFQEQTSWTSKDLAAAIGVPVDVLNRRVSFWISKGILAESFGTDSSDHVFTLVDGMIDNGKTGISSGNCEELAADEDGDRSVASVEDQLRKEMTVYEKFITGMLTNFGSMALDRIHNTLKMFCIADPTYDKSLQQLQSFLSGLVAEEKLELRDGMYLLKK
ncbi:Anaphase-promoting complex subunit 2 [Heracleum sosnowskyi]|uniref:Anaphase-promoting complex subunit 2 n=1 Tax=Heracleum sosnowskyi TaxID=360622 RepID=A0AAD8I6L5_9APIA|nr:Anaphase-promoting complex subunit 2 [Heracleum sosnowskyi]